MSSNIKRKLPRYTEKVHRRRLTQMLNKKKPCTRCPATEGITADTFGRDLLWSSTMQEICEVCREFIEISQLRDIRYSLLRCPCCILGKQEALERTYAKLQKKGARK